MTKWISIDPGLAKYVVAYEGQILTDPLDIDLAHYVAMMENADILAKGSVSVAIAEVLPVFGSDLKTGD